MGVTRNKIVTEAKKLIGIEWVHQGRDPNQGVDCVGLLAIVGKKCGVKFDDLTNYTRYPEEEELLAYCRRWMIELPLTDDAFKPGNVAAVRVGVNRHREIKHVGIFGPHPQYGVSLIHADNRISKRVVEHGVSDKWKARIGAIFQVPGVIE